MTTQPIAISMNYVYENAAGEKRLAVSVSPIFSSPMNGTRRRQDPQPVVNWRTANPKLAAGGKAQGSATLRSFERWAVSCRMETAEDWEAFQSLQGLRSVQAETRRMYREIRKQQGTWPPAKR